jgi:hypothetical protein
MATPPVPRSTEDLWNLSIEELLKPMTEMPRLGGPGPFVINLSTATAPIDVSPQMAAAFAPESLYLIQRTEDRRLRYRLRLGPFATEDAADEMLLKVREIYPCALTATAAEDDLRAIAAAQPRTPFARTHVQASTAAPATVGTPAAVAAPSRTASPTSAPAPTSTPAPASLASPTPIAAPLTSPPRAPAPRAPAPRAMAPTTPVAAASRVSVTPAAQPRPASPTYAAPPAAAAPAASPAAQAAPTPSATVSPTRVAATSAPASVVARARAPAPTSPPTSPPAVARTPAPIRQSAPPAGRTASPMQATRPPSLETTQTVRPLTALELESDDESHWFAIQLSVAEQPFDPDELPSLDIFNVYRLYSVAGHDQGRVRHALRLGFFAEEIAARAVASYLAGYYDNAAVKRVSRAERERFGQRRVEARKDVGATGNHAVIEITNERVARPKRSVASNAGAPASP